MRRGKVGKRHDEEARRGSSGGESALHKIACLLGVFATKDLDQTVDRVILLRRVGFTVSEVASILGITENHVMVATHHAKKKTKAVRTKKRS